MLKFLDLDFFLVVFLSLFLYLQHFLTCIIKRIIGFIVDGEKSKILSKNLQKIKQFFKFNLRKYETKNLRFNVF